MKKCSNKKCNNLLEDEALYCSACGAKWTPEKKKKRWILPVILGVILVAGGYFVFKYSQSDPLSSRVSSQGIQTEPAIADMGSEETGTAMPPQTPLTAAQSTLSPAAKQEEKRRELFLQAEQAFVDGRWRASLEALRSITPQDDMAKWMRLEYNKVFSRMGTAMFTAGKYNTAFLSSDYGVSVLGDNQYKEKEANKWTDIGFISLGDRHIVGVKLDGSAVAAGDNSLGQCNVEKWEDIALISAGDVHTVALTHSGHLLATGYNDKGQCNVEQLEKAANGREIIGIAAGYRHTLALLEDGKVVACGDESCYKGVELWSNIAAVYANTTFSAGLTTDGRVRIEGKTKSGQDASYIWGCEWWPKIDMLSLGDYFLVAVTEDGHVISAGLENQNMVEVLKGWEDVWMIAAGHDHVVALTSRGYVLSTGARHDDLHDVYGYTLSDSPAMTGPEYEDITVIFSEIHKEDGKRGGLVSGINADGTVLWQYKSPLYQTSHLTPVCEIACGQEKYYFFEFGTIKALDKKTGDLVWENTDFDGSNPCGYEDTDGKLYLSGYLPPDSPDLFIIDASGKTIRTVELNPDFLYSLPCRIEKQGNQIVLIMDMGPEAEADPEEHDFVFLMDPVTWEYVYAGPIQEVE